MVTFKKVMDKSLRKIRDKKIALLAASGKTQAEIGKEVGLGREQTGVILNRKESREIIEQQTSRLLQLLPDIIDQYKTDFDLSKKLSEILANPGKTPELYKTMLDNVDQIIKFQTLTHKKQTDLLKILGVMPSQAPNVFIQQIYQDNRSQVLDNDVLKLFAGMFKDSDDDNIQEAEIINEED